MNPPEGLPIESERAWEVEFRIAGWQYGPGESMLSEIRAGETLLLEPEPNNPYDPNAVQILTRSGVKLGYVPRYLTSDLADRLALRSLKTKVIQILRDAPIYNRVIVPCSDQW